MSKVYISNNPEALAETLQAHKVYAVVEAEYGGKEVLGSSDLLTLNHHVRSERPCPCSLSNADFAEVREQVEAIGLSHFDLDTLGGVAALLGVKPENEKFWAMAAWVDVKGPHRIRECPQYDPDVHVLLGSFWAWSQKNRLFPPRDGSVAECTEFIQGALEELKLILSGDNERLERGKQFLQQEEQLKRESFVRDGVSASGLKIVLRKGAQFVNHLYYMEDGSPADVVVGYSLKFKSVTVSRATDDVPIVAKDVVQELWGELAGGHAGIAGSPRGQELELEEAVKAFEHLLKR